MSKKKKYPYKINVIITVALYLIFAFVKWDITFIRELPSYTMGDRGLIIYCFAWIHAGTLLFIKLLQ